MTKRENYSVKINKKKLVKICKSLKLNETRFAEEYLGKGVITRQWLNSVSGKNMKHKLSYETARTIFESVKDFCKFEELFYWVD